MNKILSPFYKISKTFSIGLKPVQNPNPVLQVGIFNNVMGSMPQVEFLKVKTNNAVQNLGDNGTYSNVTGKGQIYVTESKDYYMGEGVNNEA
jgi:hypothetical protein